MLKTQYSSLFTHHSETMDTGLQGCSVFLSRTREEAMKGEISEKGNKHLFILGMVWDNQPARKGLLSRAACWWWRRRIADVSCHLGAQLFVNTVCFSASSPQSRSTWPSLSCPSCACFYCSCSSFSLCFYFFEFYFIVWPFLFFLFLFSCSSSVCWIQQLPAGSNWTVSLLLFYAWSGKTHL